MSFAMCAGREKNNPLCLTKGEAYSNKWHPALSEYGTFHNNFFVKILLKENKYAYD
jgi:hypothetical protein